MALCWVLTVTWVIALDTRVSDFLFIWANRFEQLAVNKKRNEIFLAVISHRNYNPACRRYVNRQGICLIQL